MLFRINIICMYVLYSVLYQTCVCVCVQGGNKAVDLAEQEENCKCASVLQEYESHTPQVECEDLPKFHYCKSFVLENCN